MSKDLAQRISRAKELLRTARHATMATVNEDNSPHNTPFFLMYDDKLKCIYWGSHLESLHSKNILRTGQIFVVIYDTLKRGGLYLRAEKGHALQDAELDEALKIHNKFRAREGKAALEKNYYSGNNPQRMWSAEITNFWVNSEERDSNGHIIRDYRQEIKAEDLLN